MCEALTVRLNLMISPRQLDALKAASKLTGAPVSELVRRAVEKEHPSQPCAEEVRATEGDRFADALESYLTPRTPPSTP